MRWGGGGGGGEVVKYCKLKDCQKDDAQKALVDLPRGGEGF